MKKLWPHAALLGTNIFFAINFTAVKYLINGKHIQAFGLNFIRMLVTVTMLWFIYLFKKNKFIIDKSDIARLLLCALTGIAINQLLFIKGLSLTYSIHASLLMLATPIMITLIAAVFLKERITSVKAIGLLLGICGGTLLISMRENSGSGTDVFWGDILVVLNAVSYSVFFVIVKPLMKKHQPLDLMRILFTIGLIVATPFCWKEFTEIPWQQYKPVEFYVLALVTIGGTFCAYVFNVIGIKHLGASVAGSYIYLQPFFATAIAMIVLGESLNVYKVVAAVLIFAGVYLANKSQADV